MRHLRFLYRYILDNETIQTVTNIGLIFILLHLVYHEYKVFFVNSDQRELFAALLPSLLTKVWCDAEKQSQSQRSELSIMRIAQWHSYIQSPRMTVTRLRKLMNNRPHVFYVSPSVWNVYRHTCARAWIMCIYPRQRYVRLVHCFVSFFSCSALFAGIF